METVDFSQLGRAESASMAIVDILHGYVRLCFALTHLHRGLLDKVC